MSYEILENTLGTRVEERPISIHELASAAAEDRLIEVIGVSSS